MEIRTACFFGHRDVTHDIRTKLQSIIEQLITEEQINSFYSTKTVCYFKEERLDDTALRLCSLLCA